MVNKCGSLGGSRVRDVTPNVIQPKLLPSFTTNLELLIEPFYVFSKYLALRLIYNN